MPIHAPQVGILGNFDPLMGSSINKTPKRHILARICIVWAAWKSDRSGL